MIRVSHIFDGTQIGGAVSIAKAILDRMDRKRFEPVPIASEHGKFVDHMVESGYKVRILASDIAQKMKVLLSSKTLNPLNFLEFYKQLCSDAKKLRKLLKEENVDILHSHQHPHHLLSALACRREIPTIWHLHGMINRNTLYGIQWRFYNYYAAQYSFRLIAISNAVRNSMSPKVQTKTIVVNNGIQIEEFGKISKYEAKCRFGLPTEIPIVAAVGRFTPLKGFYDFILMAESIISKLKGVHFVLVGSDESQENKEYREACFERIVQSNLQKHFTIKKSLTNPARFMPAFDIVVLPTTTREGFGLTVLEAQATGLPVVATDCGGPADIILEGKTGFIVPRRDYNAMAERVLRLLLHSDLARDMGLAGRIHADEPRFNITNVVKRIEDIYISLNTNNSTEF